MPSFVEFFAGGGFARLGLGAAWKCVLANDVSPEKAATYRANHGAGELRLQDVRTLAPSDIPAADLWWASFPCQDHSSAGRRVGFAGDRGSLVFEITRLLHAALAAGIGPRLIAMENVTGFVRAAGGRDFVALATALTSAGFRVGAVMADAKDFVPQSRQRMLLVAVRDGTEIPDGMVSGRPDPALHPKVLVTGVAALPNSVGKRWVWWRLSQPTPHRLQLADMLDADGGADQKWLSPERTAALVAKVAGQDRVRLERAMALGRQVAATTVGVRKDMAEGPVRVQTVRTDGVAGCLMCRTKSNRQQLMVIGPDAVGIRNFTPRELGRLMGLPTDYRLPGSEPEAVRLTGDGVVVPVVRWLAANLLEPLVAGTEAVVRPRTAALVPSRAPAIRNRKAVGTGGKPLGGIKQVTVGTTAYFLPDEAARMDAVAAELGVSKHELIILALDRMLAGRGEPPVRRYAALKG